MLRPAPLSPRRTALWGMVVVGLLLGMIGMHHLAVGAEGAGHHGSSPVMVTQAATHAEHVAAEGAGLSDVLHLCMAVLGAAAFVAIGLGLRRHRAVELRMRTRRPGRPRTSSRAPPPPVPRRLAQLCVLRT